MPGRQAAGLQGGWSVPQREYPACPSPPAPGLAPTHALLSGYLRGSAQLCLEGVCSQACKVLLFVTAVKSNSGIAVTGELAWAVYGTYSCEAAF